MLLPGEEGLQVYQLNQIAYVRMFITRLIFGIVSGGRYFDIIPEKSIDAKVSVLLIAETCFPFSL